MKMILHSESSGLATGSLCNISLANFYRSRYFMSHRKQICGKRKTCDAECLYTKVYSRGLQHQIE